jgi:flavin reductase (DIM6/NTAB) family NADH-FMN oxidoreductase RutF/DNA-binding GntR family transcriptional regulator
MNAGYSSQLDQALFRDVIGRFASGVTVITTRAEDRDFGTTASAVSSLSMDPPMLLVCLNTESETQRAIHASMRFAVNILGEDQADVAYRFAKKSGSKFVEGDIVRAPTDIPMLAQAIARLECRVREKVRAATHTVFLAEVEHASGEEGSPLTYYRGRFGRFEDALQEAAYRRLRGMILARSVPVGEPLDVDALAREMGVEGQRVYYALTKLSTDGLVVHEADKGYMARPLDARLAEDAIQARSLIQMAVARTVVGSIDSHDLAELRAHAEAAVASVHRDPPDLRALAQAGRAFHQKFIGLTSNEILLDIHRRLGVEAIWLRALRHQETPAYLNPEYLVALVEALEAGDVERSCDLLLTHAMEARQVARRAIEAAGGNV